MGGGHFSHFTIVSNASELVKRHKYFGRRYAPSIQRWGFDPTNRVSLQDLGGIKSPSFSVPCIKAHKSIIFSFLHHSSESSEHSKIQTHQPSNHSSYFKKSSKILLRISKISSCFSSRKFSLRIFLYFLRQPLRPVIFPSTYSEWLGLNV